MFSSLLIHMRNRAHAGASAINSAGGIGVLGALSNTFQTQITSLQNFGREIHTSSSFRASDPIIAKQREIPPPWTPTSELSKRKTLPKRMGHLLSVLETERLTEAQPTKTVPDFRAGDVLELKLSVPENKRRTTTFKGICIAKFNKGIRTSVTLRNFIGSTGGIERTFPLYSPHVLEVKVLQSNHKKYRRSKLYYLRDRQPKEYRVG